LPHNEVQILHDSNRKQKFLEHLAGSSHVANSARYAGIAISTVYNWRETDPEFYTQWMRALSIGYEFLEMDIARAV